MTVWL